MNIVFFIGLHNRREAGTGAENICPCVFVGRLCTEYPIYILHPNGIVGARRVVSVFAVRVMRPLFVHRGQREYQNICNSHL